MQTAAPGCWRSHPRTDPGTDLTERHAGDLGPVRTMPMYIGLDRRGLLSMYKLLVVIAALGIAWLLFIGVIAPQTPEGSWLHEFGQDMRDAMSSWFANPVRVD